MAAWFRLVRFGFYLLYNQFAWTYDFVSWFVSLGEWRKWQFAGVDFVRGQKVLEVAHGTGHCLVEMHHRGFSVIGYDLSPYMGRMAQRRLKKFHIDLPLIRGQAQHLPFSAETFDSILTTFPTDFIIQPDTLISLHHTLKQDGRLVIVPEGHLTTTGLVERFIRWLFIITGQVAADATPANLWDGWKARFAAAGFDLTVHTVTLKRSETTVLVAEKL